MTASDGQHGFAGRIRSSDYYDVARGIAGQRADPCSWVSAVVQRRNKNVAAVALANKNARIVWALLAHERSYEKG